VDHNVTNLLPLIERAQSWPDRRAIVDDGSEYSYQQLIDDSARVATGLLDGAEDLQEARICFLVPPGYQYVVTQWGIWRAGGIAVPLGMMHPLPELQYCVEDTAACAIVADPAVLDKAEPLAESTGVPLLMLDQLSQSADAALPALGPERRAMILYTSGTTSRPKGVVTTHANIQAQITALVDAWGWSQDDQILHVLPLHHIHGIINVLCCALWSGACCEFQPGFDANAAWQRIAAGDLSLFMAVPTIYARLITAWQEASVADQQRYSAGASQLRLMVSGSAALPVSTLDQWRVISNQTLLERYGMTEIGMALSNSLEGERVPGAVGRPLSNMEVRRVDEQGKPLSDEEPCEIQVRGPGVFSEYWQRPAETTAAFVDGWFRTGDVTVVENGVYRILGRSSVDIIKTGGYKVSALEIEEVLRTHNAIDECAVVGIEDAEWGERVAACLVCDASLTLEELRQWAKQQLAVYKVPSRLIVVEELPRNAMGKVQKPAIKRLFPPTEESGSEGSS
jgi:malonyl-CoA/methylmalonyl-CoA synthetase